MEGSGLPGGYQYPPGFRFHPSDQELILHYLNKKITATLPQSDAIIAEIDLYKFSPWDLPDKAFFGEGEWFFFSPRDRKYPNGARPNRAAGCGYWKATGTDKPILAVGGTQCLGVKKALVFYKGRPPKGIKTDWVMHEYRLLDGNPSLNLKHKGSMRLDDWVLCRVRQKGNMLLQSEEGPDSPNAAQFYTNQQPLKPEMRGDSAIQWGDYQLLAYLMGTTEEEHSDTGSARSSVGGGGGGSGGSLAPMGTQSPQLSSVLDKRNLAFGTLDDIMMLPPSKRLNFSNGVGDEMSPSGSFSVDQVYLR